MDTPHDIAVKPGEPRVYYPTTSVCPGCSRLVPAVVVGRDNGVFVERECPEHGFFSGVVCSDRAWWDSLPRFDVPPVKPKNPLRMVDKGCPSDCGLCSSHRQIAGTAAIEISNRCNANCPVCLADNKGTFDLTPAQVRTMIEGLLQRQDRVDALALSGGEPTIHPQIFEIITEAERFPGVARIALNSNGVRIAQDDAFLDELKKHPKVYVSLHFDGSGARTLRGIDRSLQERALERLDRWGIDAAPLVLVAKGVNEGELGELCNSLLRRPSVRSVVVSLMTYAGSGGSTFAGDALTRLTIP
ncbi:MAG: radical SAM protein, partial [Deltaproteobacteria bacterium]